ncbi:tryptophan synthase subunit alpha [Anaeromyxobacter oryzae]|uniref:Tryptophan synthase alpha chain n=1 Tax=Anaeromyxobacter oryzae TaxID=2918170 RepID=A0ABM7WWQ9_9BACT|nr:tryptophan synthase subunit alpha [Anaeromyxobacter oryzae]BDG03955.1 tryptophan synthase alpha chain [Anaeromyxobacter oryzae]
MTARPARKAPARAAAPEAAPADRIAAAFARCRDAGEAALVTYVMGGDPDLATSKAMALACVEGGADLLEIGVPFSDPIADGPTIQGAAERALAAGATVAGVLEVARAVRARSQVPIALMGYLNPMLARGAETFAKACAEAGVDALIVPDLLPEEAEVLAAPAAAHGVKIVYLLAPTSNPARVEAAARAATGFLYFVSVTGVTGAKKAVPAEIGAQVAAVREKSPVPVVIGFGVSTPEDARALAPLADGVVVGSAIVKRIAEGGSRAARAERVRKLVASLKRALRR